MPYTYAYLLEISDKCSEWWFKNRIKKRLDYQDFISFLNERFDEQFVVKKYEFENFLNGFNQVIKTTVDPIDFLKNELEASKNLIDRGLNKLEKRSKLEDEMYKLVLIQPDEEKILKGYFNEFVLRGDIESFVRVYHCIGMVRYLAFLNGYSKGHRIEDQPNHRSDLINGGEDTKKAKEIILDKNGNKFSLRTIARYYRISNINIIGNSHANEEVGKFGWKSGKALNDCFKSYKTPNERIAVNSNDASGFNKRIKDYESLIELCKLMDNKESIETAEQELAELEKRRKENLS